MLDLEHLSPAVAERLREIDDETWGDMYLELLDFARYKKRRLDYVKGGGELPLGRKPEDLVQDAIKRLFEGDRQWDPDKDPDLCDYLKSVISSIVSGLLEKTDYEHKDDSRLEDHFDLPSDANPTHNDCLEALRDILEEESSDEEDLENVRLGIEDGMKPAEISDFFGIEVEKVYTLSRKLRRRMEKRMEQHPCNEHWTRLGF
jgi:DNA-directed RNA polymerase specialized sigma24 family protein